LIQPLVKGSKNQWNPTITGTEANRENAFIEHKLANRPQVRKSENLSAERLQEFPHRDGMRIYV
ncbi:hypothetical protein LAN31_25280, partial [Mycobacterium tuberculosis]|nr:hypothetical protein [Mycobacterium tuberculosis]